ncbi:MAG TPA: cytochrome C [Aquifex aeolicus]|nr:cytochrome C [Aquifex aeolicus]
MASPISPRSLAPSLLLFFSSFSTAGSGESLYLKHCAQCHHEDRIGRTAPPLLPEFLKKKSSKELTRIIKEGIPSSGMPPFDFLPDKLIGEIVEYLRSPHDSVSFTLRDVRSSRSEWDGPSKDLGVKDIRNVTVLIDKGGGRVLVLEGSRVLDTFPLRNVHGGVKFSERGFYVPTRDGWVAYYDLWEGRLKAKVRACIYLRNIALAGDRLATSCVLPSSIVLFDRELRPLAKVELKGNPSAIYGLGEDGFVLAFRDIPLVGRMDVDGTLSYFEVDTPLEDFFIDPFREFIIGSSRKEKKLIVYELRTLRKVFEKDIDGLAHLFSAGFWYSGGSFYFATRHAGSTKVSLWKMYEWELLREIDTGGTGFFVRTSPKIPHLWIDNGDDSFLLLDKKTLNLSKLKIAEGHRVTHVEFSADGRLAYVSVKGKINGFYLYDPLTLRYKGMIRAEDPAGKYNYLLKRGRFSPALLGEEVFMAKCWGCHHSTREAFGPSLEWIVTNRSRDYIESKLKGLLGGSMPKIPLSFREIRALISFMEAIKHEERFVERGEKYQ